MSEMTMPKNVAMATDVAVVKQIVESRPDAGRHSAAGALNIAHKRPIPGSPSTEALAPGLPPSPLHNLHFLLELTARARQAIERGTYGAFLGEWLAGPGADDY